MSNGSDIMKRDDWIVVFIVVVGGGLIVVLSLSGVNYCHWDVMKKYNVTVNSTAQAASILNAYERERNLIGPYVGYSNVTASELKIIGDDFVENSASNSGNMKISKDGVISEESCLFGQ
jgi:hypothetical protein